MTHATIKDPVASERQRLRNGAAERGEAFGYILTRFAVQRLVDSLSGSEFREQFLLKGATLFAIWSKDPHRPTRDLDLLGVGENEVAAVAQFFRSLCLLPTDGDDALVFDSESVVGQTIRETRSVQGFASP